MINYNIDNYKELLLTLCNQDEIDDNIRKSFIVVYDTFNNDVPIALFGSSKNCGKFFNTSERVINCAISRQGLRNKRYRIERINLKEEDND